nr:BTI-3=trypsin inhibitor isoform {N-terminal} [Fagopyrum esculentum=buckwheat, Monch, seeds, Peptide Partial, 38 aa] [Fagopyrum esculentum]
GSCGKQEWPELVGTRGPHAAAIIERENRNVQTAILPEG